MKSFQALIGIRERETVANDKHNTDIYRTEALFEDKQAFVSGMNIVAFCSIKCNITILAFCLMDNHVHFILYGTLEECMQFRDRFTHQYAIWYSNRYLKKRTEDLDFDIKVMEEEKYVLTSIAYVLRNSIAAGYAFCSEDYPWSSGGLYFRIPQKMEAHIRDTGEGQTQDPADPYRAS